MPQDKKDNPNSRLNYKGNAVKFKDDDYETHSGILRDLIPYLYPNSKVYDPFYANGEVIKHWECLGFECINEKKDAFHREHPEEFDYVISNIPFSIKEECVKLAFSLGKPFALLMPIDALGSKWISKYFTQLEFLIPNKRYNFLKKNEMTKGCWFDTMFVCHTLSLPSKIDKVIN